MTFPISATLQKLIRVINNAGGHAFVVGGAVRDFILGIEPKDFDLEVYGLPIENLNEALSCFKVDAVGKSFGVLKVMVDGETFDVALPRSENKQGSGHRGFIVQTDCYMTPLAACQRRDLTINALMFDTISKTIRDEVGGLADIQNKIIRAVSPAFAEDPLRVMRACQFAARFNFTIDPATIDMCRTLIPEMKTLPVERFWTEWQKLLLKSDRPSVGLEAMKETGALTLFPELEALIGVQQDPEWHPEGDVWIHNNMVVDSAVKVCREDKLDEQNSLIVMLGALCHDLGKPLVTEFKAGASGEIRWRAHDHEAQGEAPTISFLTRIGCPPAIIEAVVPLVQHHLKPFHLARDKASLSAVRRLAVKVPIKNLCRVARADFWGRTTPDALACKDSSSLEEIVWLLEQAEKANVSHGKPQSILLGRHLIQRGLVPGPHMGVILAAAFEAQLDGAFEEIEAAQLWLTDYFAKN